MKYEKFEDYFWDGQNCMRNKLNIHNQIELDMLTNELAFQKLGVLPELLKIEKFDSDTIRSIHKTLFQDVYDWAGEFRACPQGRNMDYADPSKIPDKIDRFCEDFKKDFLDRTFVDEWDMGYALGDHWAKLNAIHPFRDGNGRSQFAFFNEACKSKGYVLEFEPRDLRSLRDARDSASEGRTSFLGNMIARSLKIYDQDIARKHVGTEAIRTRDDGSDKMPFFKRLLNSIRPVRMVDPEKNYGGYEK